jgi:hypothetical protein
MSKWQYTNDELLGRKVVCLDGYGEEFSGIVVAVHTRLDTIQVMDCETWEVLVGNQWEEE